MTSLGSKPKRVNKPAHIPHVRLLIAGLISLSLLAGMAFHWFGRLGSTAQRFVPMSLCAFILVTLLPVMLRGSTGQRWLALALAVFPLLLLALIFLSTGFVHSPR